MKIQFIDSNNDYFEKTSHVMNMSDTHYQTTSFSSFFRNPTGNSQFKFPKSILINCYYKL